MNEASISDRSVGAQDAKDLSTSFAALMPAVGADTSSFLYDVAYALGEKEAELARILGVSHATLSSWKRRGSIAESHRPWFERNFVPEVLRGRTSKQHEDFGHLGLEVALAVFRVTDFDPYRNCHSTDAQRVESCYRNLGGLSRIGLFVLHRLPPPTDKRYGDHLIQVVAPKVVELIRLANPILSQ